MGPLQVDGDFEQQLAADLDELRAISRAKATMLWFDQSDRRQAMLLLRSAVSYLSSGAESHGERGGAAAEGSRGQMDGS